MDPAAMQAKRKARREQRELALSITDTALAENRQLTGDEARVLNEHVERAKQLHSEIEGARLGAGSELLKQLNEVASKPENYGPGTGIGAGIKAEACVTCTLGQRRSSRARNQKQTRPRQVAFGNRRGRQARRAPDAPCVGHARRTV